LVQPIWNVLIDGFGSKVEGVGRADSARSVWDILHPGRKENLAIQVAPAVEAKIVADLRNARTIDVLHPAIKAHRDAKRQFRKTVSGRNYDARKSCAFGRTRRSSITLSEHF